MNPIFYALLALLKTGDEAVIDAIDTLTTPERRVLLDAAIALGVQRIPRNLAYNYDTQEWV